MRKQSIATIQEVVWADSLTADGSWTDHSKKGWHRFG